MYEVLEEVLQTVVRYGILAVEAVGVVVMLVGTFRALVRLFTDRGGSRRIMAEGVTTALSFLLGGELLKTLIAPDWRDLGMTCAILLMRAAMAVLLHWESKNEEHEG